MNIVDKITQQVLFKLNEDNIALNNAYDDATKNKAKTNSRELKKIHKQNQNMKNDVKNKKTKIKTTSNVNFTSKPKIDLVTKESKKEEIKTKINEIKSIFNKFKNSIPENVIQEAKYKNFMKKLNEYINIEDDFEEFENGDEILDDEIKKIDCNNSQSVNFIDQIRKQALQAMATLADDSQSPEFQTMNNIFVQCQKYANDANKKTDDKNSNNTIA